MERWKFLSFLSVLHADGAGQLLLSSDSGQRVLRRQGQAPQLHPNLGKP
jgi:hypothetical protein